MGLKSWIWAKLEMPEFRAEQRRRLNEWELNQADDDRLIADDPLKSEVAAACERLDEEPLEAFPKLLELAQQGSVWGMVQVGWCFGSGTGVAKCAEQADWYRLAYEAGSQHGLLRYALYLEWRDESAKAQKVYETGWDLGLTPAVFRLTQARLKPSTMTLAERLAWKPGLEWAAAAGHPGARFLLAKYLFRGVFGIRGIPLGLKLTWGLFAAILRGDENRAIGV